MKILHIVPTYIPAYRYGGPIMSVHGLNKSLVKKGVQVTVYTTNIDGSDDLKVPIGVPVDIDGVKVYYFKASRLLRFWFYSGQLRLALNQNVKDFDLVHITSVFLAASTVGAYYARKFGKPYVISPRGSLMEKPLAHNALKKKPYLFLEKINLKNAAAIHFTDELEQKEYPFELGRSIVIPNGLDADELDQEVPAGLFRKKFDISADKKIILFLGRINWKKGLDTLIPAFGKVLKHDSNCVLVIVGDDDGYKKEAEKLIEQNGIGGSVIFTGMLLGKDKLGAYRDAALFVLPSYSENFGMAVIEAAYCGLPVIISTGVAISDKFKKEGAGLVVEKDVSALSDAMLDLIKDPEKAKELGQRGRQLVAASFSLPRVAERFINEYKQLLTKHA